MGPQVRWARKKEMNDASEIPNFKFQIPNKFQASNSNDQNCLV
jgi:hypothetical protein